MIDHIVGIRKLHEDDLIKHILQNKPPTTMPIDELVEESLEKSKGNNWNVLFFIDHNLYHAKVVEISPSRNLNINPSLSS